MSYPALESWNLTTGKEPSIRVGVVLPEDAVQELEIVVPDGPWTLAFDDGAARPAGPARLLLRVEGSTVVVHDLLNEREPASGSELRLAASSPVALERGAGVKLLGLRIGRGFHWEKHVDLTFCGALEFRVHNHLLLVSNTLPLEQYLAGVISAEMSGDCPVEFLKTQCIVARSWVLARTEDKHFDLGLDRCNDDCCQRYQGTNDLTPNVLEAVRATRGQIITEQHRDQIIDANYCKNCGGISEDPHHVWFVRKPGQRPTVDAPRSSVATKFFPLDGSRLDEYLEGDWLATTDVFCSPHVVPDAELPRYLGKVDEGGGHFRWKVSYTRAELEALLRRKHFSKTGFSQLAPLAELVDIRVLSRGVSGRANEIEIVYLSSDSTEHRARISSEYAIRAVLHDKFLFSSAFQVRTKRSEDGELEQIELVGAGWGHGAGLCQIGALGMALRNHTCEEILRHYFEPIRIWSCYH